MKRQDAIKKASKFLGRKNEIKTGSTAKKVKDRAKRNPDLNRAGLTQIVADIYQRGDDPRDLDLERIDFSVSYSNIRGQVEDLLKKRQGSSAKFQSEKDAERKTGKEIAEQRNKRRPAYNQFIDQTKNAETTFPHATDKAVRKWSRNPNKYDIKGVDTRREKEARTQAQLPFRRKSRIQDMKKGIKSRYGSLAISESNVPNEEFERQSRIEALKEKKIADFEQERNKNKLVNKGRKSIISDKNLDLKGSNLAKNKDSRSVAELGKSIRGTTTQRSNQKGLREMGMVSKSSEKTLDKFSKSVSDSGKQVTEKFDGDYF